MPMPTWGPRLGNGRDRQAESGSAQGGGRLPPDQGRPVRQPEAHLALDRRQDSLPNPVLHYLADVLADPRAVAWKSGTSLDLRPND